MGMRLDKVASISFWRGWHVLSDGLLGCSARRGVPGRGNCKCRSPEAEIRVTSLRNRKNRTWSVRGVGVPEGARDEGTGKAGNSDMKPLQGSRLERMEAWHGVIAMEVAKHGKLKVFGAVGLIGLLTHSP